MQGCLRPTRAQAGPRGPSSTIPGALVRTFPPGPRGEGLAPGRLCGERPRSASADHATAARSWRQYTPNTPTVLLCRREARGRGGAC